METTTTQSIGIWQNDAEKIAFGLFCAHAEGHRAKINLMDAANCLTLTAEDLRAAFEALGQRGILDVALMLHRPGMLLAETPDPKTFDNPCSPEDYFDSARALLGAQKPNMEVI